MSTRSHNVAFLERVFVPIVLRRIFEIGCSKPLVKQGTGVPFGLATWWALALTCRTLHMQCARAVNVRRDFPFEQRLRALLSLHEPAPSQLTAFTLDLLRMKQCVISGLAVLQAVVYGELYSHADIDITYVGILLPENLRFISVLMYPEQMSRFIESKHVVHWQGFTFRDEETARTMPPYGIHFQSRNLVVDHCWLNTVALRAPLGLEVPTIENVVELIRTRFDVSCCAVALYYGDDNAMRFWAAFPDDLIMKRMRYTSLPGVMQADACSAYAQKHAIERESKYIARGFHFPTSVDAYDLRVPVIVDDPAAGYYKCEYVDTSTHAHRGLT
jgi:hypothetical protein